MKKFVWLLLFFTYISSSAQIKNSTLPSLPTPTTNHVVVKADLDGRPQMYVFGGLTDTQSIANMTNKAWRLDLTQQNSEKKWVELSPLPSVIKSSGHMASSAVTIGDNIYIVTGFTHPQVNKPNKTSEVYRYHIPTDQYALMSEIPISVADSLAVTYKERYVYLIGGWHLDAPVNTVQIFDTYKNEWSMGSPLPGPAVFGHAGAIIDNVLLFCDGATTTTETFRISKINSYKGCFLGQINVITPKRIAWQQWVHPTDVGKYKMAAYADLERSTITFLGGSEKLHDFAGKTQNQQPLTDNQGIWVFDLNKNSWRVINSTSTAFDLNSVVEFENQFWILGGMKANGDISPSTISLPSR